MYESEISVVAGMSFREELVSWGDWDLRLSHIRPWGVDYTIVRQDALLDDAKDAVLNAAIKLESRGVAVTRQRILNIIYDKKEENG